MFTLMNLMNDLFKDVKVKIKSFNSINDNPCYISYYESGNIKCEMWFREGMLFRENNLPSCIVYFDNLEKSISQKFWYISSDTDFFCLESNHKLHNEGDNPAHVEYYESGNIKLEIWYKNDEIKRVGDLPAIISYYDLPNKNVKFELWEKNINRIQPHAIGYYPSGNVKMLFWEKGECIKKEYADL